jgi:pentatricopeptide repeat protein
VKKEPHEPKVRPSHTSITPHGAVISDDPSEHSNGLSDTSKSYAANGEVKEAIASPADEFRRKYEEIWGGLKIKPHQRNVASPSVTLLKEGPYSTGNETSRSKEPTPKPLNRTADIVHAKTHCKSKRIRNAGIPQRLLKRRSHVLHYNHRQMRKLKLPRKPTKWVSWTPGKSSYLLDWERRFAILNVRHQYYRRRPKFISTAKNQFLEEFKKALIEHDSSVTLRASWEMIPEAQREKLWPELICTALDKYPNASLKVLAATYTEPYPPDYAASDSVDFIVSHYLRNKQSPEPRDVLKVYGVICYLLRNGPPGHLHLDQSSIYLLLTNLDQAQVKPLYEILEEVEHPLHHNTLMQFSYRLASSGDTDSAFKVLKRIRDRGGDFNSPKMLSLCARVLERKGRHSSTGISDSQIFEFMLKCEMKPNIIIYNILLRNSFEGGDHETGWQIYDMMIENGIKADEHTYSILLNDSKLRMDQSALRRVIGMIRESGIHNAHIGTDILHAILLLNHGGAPSRSLSQRHKSPTSFERMLPVYCEYFDSRPLAQIIPVFLTRFGDLIPHSSKSESVMEPPAPTLIVMLTGLLMESTPQNAINYYHWFQHLVSTGNTVVSGLLQSTHVYNLFLMAFGQSSKTLDWCPRIIGDMLSTSANSLSARTDTANQATSKSQVALPEPLSRGAGNETSLSDTSRSPRAALTNGGTPDVQASSDSCQSPPLPDVYTWSILLDIFISHRQARAAEKVLTMMESRGVIPNQVTWNSLAVGYARMQDIGMTVDVIDRLEKANLQADDITMRGMSRIKNRRALIEAMKAKEDANSKTTSESRNTHKALDLLDKALIADGQLHGMLQDEYIRDGTGKVVPVVRDIISRDLEPLYSPVRPKYPRLKGDIGEDSVVHEM